MFNLKTRDQHDPRVAILSFQGGLDRNSYRYLIDKASEFYESGYRNLALDMRDISSLGLAGSFALYSIAMLFNGEMPLDPAGGLRALSMMVDKVVNEPTQHFKLFRPQLAIKNALSQLGLPVYEDMESVLASFGAEANSILQYPLYHKFNLLGR